MSWLAILALIGLFIGCSALSRRSACNAGTPGDAHTTEELEAQLADLTEAYHRLETDMATRDTELEERLDFTERMLAQQKRQVHLGASA